MRLGENDVDPQRRDRVQRGGAQQRWVAPLESLWSSSRLKFEEGSSREQSVR